jgi:probable HAF family extracellular repeat protein
MGAMGAICAALIGLDRNSASAAEFYRITSPISYDSPSAVSPDGAIVLTSQHIWTPAGGLAQFAGRTDFYTRAISNNGVIVGLIDGSYLAFRTTLTGPLAELGAFPGGSSGDYSDAFGITPDGNVVVGYASSADGYEAFRWTAATGLVGLGHLAPGDHFSDTAYGVSADGSMVVGVAESVAGPQAFRWTQATGMVGLGDLPGGDFNSSAQAISSDGSVIVGSSLSAAGTEAFRWTQATGMVGLGDLPGGAYHSLANATTANGAIIVGESRTTLTDPDALIWTAAAGMRSLQEVLVIEHSLGAALTGWRLAGATDISDDGNVIVGYGRNPEGRFEGFVVVIPEPSTAALAAAAILLICLGLAQRILGIFQPPKNDFT